MIINSIALAYVFLRQQVFVLGEETYERPFSYRSQPLWTQKLTGDPIVVGAGRHLCRHVRLITAGSGILTIDRIGLPVGFFKMPGNKPTGHFFFMSNQIHWSVLLFHFDKRRNRHVHGPGPTTQVMATGEDRDSAYNVDAFVDSDRYSPAYDQVFKIIRSIKNEKNREPVHGK